MNRVSLIVTCITFSATLMLTTAAHAARNAGHAHTPARNAGHAHTPAPNAGHAHTPARNAGHAHTPARTANIHPGAARTGNAHASNAHAGANHAMQGAANHANAKKADHSPANNGKASSNHRGQGGQRNFPGRGFRGFSASNWLPAFGVYSYYNPDDTVWYYWYEPFEMYLPISYINDYPPTTGNLQRP